MTTKALEAYEAAQPHIEALRDAGFAVTLFNPDEIEDGSPDSVEERMVESGWSMIEYLKENPNG